MNITDSLLTVNKYSRPGIKMNAIKGIVIHWVANKNSTAEANRNYFENRKSGLNGYGSAHFIIDLDGSIIRCIPEDEMAYHVGSASYTTRSQQQLGPYPNNCTIGIECTHIKNTGEMTEATYKALVELTKYLMAKYVLTRDDLWLHQEVAGWKDCHRWFVNNPNEWEKFKTLAAANDKIKVQIKGTVKEYDGVIKDGTSFVEFRKPLEDLGHKITWDQESKTIIVD